MTARASCSAFPPRPPAPRDPTQSQHGRSDGQHSRRDRAGMQVAFGLALAALASLAINAGVLVQHAALAAAPDVRATRPLATLRALLASRRWRTGAAPATRGWGSRSPGSARARVARSVGRRRRPRRRRPRGWAAHIAGSGTSGSRSRSSSLRSAHWRSARRRRTASFRPPGGWPCSWLRRVGLARCSRGRVGPQHSGSRPACCTARPRSRSAPGWRPRGQAHRRGSGAHRTRGGAAVTAGGFFAFQRGLQTGHALPVVTLMTAATNVVAIAGGLSLLGERVAETAAQRALHLAAFAVVPVAARWPPRGCCARTTQPDPNDRLARRNPLARTIGHAARRAQRDARARRAPLVVPRAPAGAASPARPARAPGPLPHPRCRLRLRPDARRARGLRDGDRRRHRRHRRRCGARTRTRRRAAAIERLPFAEASFDLITCLDVLEHLPDDVRALRELRRVARPGAALVGPFGDPALWSAHDERNLHYRRYVRQGVRRAAGAAGWRFVRDSHFNGVLLAPAAVMRLATRSTGGSDLERTPRRLDPVLDCRCGPRPRCCVTAADCPSASRSSRCSAPARERDARRRRAARPRRGVARGPHVGPRGTRRRLRPGRGAAVRDFGARLHDAVLRRRRALDGAVVAQLLLRRAGAVRRRSRSTRRPSTCGCRSPRPSCFGFSSVGAAAAARDRRDALGAAALRPRAARLRPCGRARRRSSRSPCSRRRC